MESSLDRIGNLLRRNRGTNNVGYALFPKPGSSLPSGCEIPLLGLRQYSSDEISLGLWERTTTTAQEAGFPPRWDAVGAGERKPTAPSCCSPKRFGVVGLKRSGPVLV